MKTEPLWIILIVAVLAYIGMYFGLIASNHKETDKFLKQVDGHVKTAESAQKDEIPGRPMIENYIASKTALVQSYDDIVKFYLERDKKFETWFDGLGEDPNTEPPVARFASILTDKIRQIKEAVTLANPEQKKWPLAGNGKQEDFEKSFSFVQKPSVDGLKVVQKAWWMFEQAYDACKKNNVHRFWEWTWNKNMSDEVILGKKPIPGPEGAAPVDEMVFGYTTFSMKLKIEVPYASVSSLVEDLLATTANHRVLFGLQEIKINRVEMKKEHLGRNETFWEKYAIASEEEQALQKALKRIQKEQEATQKDVVVEIELFAYDFFERKQPIPVEKAK